MAERRYPKVHVNESKPVLPLRRGVKALGTFSFLPHATLSGFFVS